MKAFGTQNLLKDNANFFGNEEWPGNARDVNVCENVDSISRDEVKKRMWSEPVAARYSRTKIRAVSRHLGPQAK